MHALNLSYFLKTYSILVNTHCEWPKHHDTTFLTMESFGWQTVGFVAAALWSLDGYILCKKKNHIQQTKNHHRGPIREDLKLCRTISLILQTVIIFLITKMRLNNTYYNVFVFWKELPLSPVRDVSPTFSVQLCRFLQIFRNADRLSLIWIYVSVQKDETYKQIIITQNKFINRGSLSQH